MVGVVASHCLYIYILVIDEMQQCATEVYELCSIRSRMCLRRDSEKEQVIGSPFLGAISMHDTLGSLG